MSDARCEPPEELRGRNGTHWLQYREHPMSYAEWIAAEQSWFFPHDQVVSPMDSMSTEWRYLSPVLTPAEVAALRAERDAAWNEVEREREKYKDDMHAALVEVGRWSWRSGLQDAELTTLRAEVEKLRAALKPFADAAPKFRDCGDAIEVADIAHDATFTVGNLRRAATLANAVEVPE